MMEENQNDDETKEEKEQRPPKKSKQKKSSLAAAAPKPATQSKVKSVTTDFGFYIHNHSRVIILASIKLSGATPVQEFIVNLQELLKQPAGG
jgi:hypothetical protein